MRLLFVLRAIAVGIAAARCRRFDRLGNAVCVKVQRFQSQELNRGNGGSNFANPEGHLLVVDNGRDLIAIETQTCRERRRLAVASGGGAPSWASQITIAEEGALLAVSRAAQRIVLTTSDCRRVVATLAVELPHSPTCLAPDGGRLVSLGVGFTIQFWDLALVRKRLKAFGLDWR